MKKFMSVILAALMVVAVMPFAIFAADAGAYTRPANTAHICHPTNGDGSLKLDDVDMAADATVEAVKAATDTGVIESYLTDGKKDTATRLPVGDTAKITVTFATAKDLGTLILTVNGKGKINTGATEQDQVVVVSTHNLKVNVVAKNAAGQVVFTSDKDIDTSALTDLVLNVFEEVKTIEITTVGAASATQGGPRLWEIDATTVKGEAEYTHDYEEIVTKAPTLPVDGVTDGTGTAYGVCKNCGDKKAAYVLPALTAADLTGGMLGLEHIDSFVEDFGKVDANGDPLYDDDGNTLKVDSTVLSKPENLFDGNKNSGGLWSGNGNYWTGGKGAKLTINLKEKVLVSSAKITMCINSWPCIRFSVYDGDTLLGTVSGNWKNDGTDDDRWTNTSEYFEVDLAALFNLTGKTIDKIEIEMVEVKNFNYSKISEIEIGIHDHVYDEDQINSGWHDPKDPCKRTFNGVCVECLAETKNVVRYVHDLETVIVKPAACNDGIAYDYCKLEGCEYCGSGECDYVSDEYVIPGTGAHDFSGTITQSTYATCGAAGKANFVCKYCLQREENSVDALVGKKLAADLIGNGGVVVATKNTVLTQELIDKAILNQAGDIKITATDVQSNTSVVVAYTLKFDVTTKDCGDGCGCVIEETVVSGISVGAAPVGYHTLGWKTVVPSTYTVAGLEGAYCTVCSKEMTDHTREAELLAPRAKVRFNGFSVRKAEFEGVRATFTLNYDVIEVLEAAGYEVEIYIVVANASGETGELQVYGEGVEINKTEKGKFSVAVKDANAKADEEYGFASMIVVSDKNGTNYNVEELCSTTLEAVKAAQ